MENLNRPAILGAGLKNSPLVPLKHERCKHTRTKSASINPNAIAAIHHTIKNRVTMHHNLLQRATPEPGP